MRLKSKYVTLVALIMLTATPRAFDQLADLKDFAQERFRVELRNIFWSFTTPDARRTDAKQYSELLARMQQSAPACNGTDEIRAARAHRPTGGFARATPTAADLRHRQPFTVDESSAAENSIADVATEFDWDEESPATDETAAPASKQETALVARNFSDYPLFDEAYGPVQIDDAVAQLEWSREAETPALWRAKPGTPPKRESPDAQRFTQRFVQTNFQIRLPEKLDAVLSNTTINSDTFIRIYTVPVPAKPKCRFPVAPVAPAAAPRPSEKPALVS